MVFFTIKWVSCNFSHHPILWMIEARSTIDWYLQDISVGCYKSHKCSHKRDTSQGTSQHHLKKTRWHGWSWSSSHFGTDIAKKSMWSTWDPPAFWQGLTSSEPKSWTKQCSTAPTYVHFVVRLVYIYIHMHILKISSKQGEGLNATTCKPCWNRHLGVIPKFQWHE